MAWLTLRCDTTPQRVALLEELMLAGGAVAVTLADNADEALLEPGVGETPLWQQTRVTGLFAAGTDMERVLAGFPAGLLETLDYRVDILEDRDWEREWMRHYRPMQFGPGFWVCPGWMEPPDPGAVNLLLDPGLAFGTGTHPTTALCLTALAGMSLADATVVDYGCGSGILAVAAARLGARHVLAVDNDPQALRATLDNADRNSLPPGRIQAVPPGDAAIGAFSGRGDLVVANILAGPLTALRDTLCDLLRPGGTLLLSGIIRSQATELIQHYAPRIALTGQGEREDWVCLAGRSVPGPG